MSDVDPAGTADRPDGFRRFLVLWATQTLSLFGTFVSTFAVNVWLVKELYPLPEQKAALALALTATGIATTGPLIFFMPLAGGFADRHDRRRILLAANLCSALITAILVALLVAHMLTLPLAVLMLVGYSISGSFHSAAFDSSYAFIVPQAQLPRANAMMMTSFGLAQLLSPPVAAALVGLPALLGRGGGVLPAWATSGVPFAFAADGLTFVIAAVAVAGMRFPSPPRPEGHPRQSLVADVRDGFRWILRRRPFLWLIANGSLANFMAAPLFVLMPLLVRDRLAGDAARLHLPFEAVLAITSTAGGLGGVVGGIVVSVFGLGQQSRTRMLIGSLAVFGGGCALVGLSTSIAAMAVSMFVTELLIAPLNTTSFVLWQSLTPPHMLARALSTRRFMAQSAFPIGTALAGWLAAAVEPWLVVTSAGAILATWCIVQVSRPSFSTFEERMREAAARPD